MSLLNGKDPVRVKIYKSFKYRVYPTVAQVARLNRWDGALRFLWNLANEAQRQGLLNR